MQTKITAAITLAALFAVSGCANMSETQKGTAKGAGIGAGVGAVVGGIAGGNKGAVTGAVIGGAAGGIGGNIWSRRMQEQKKQMEEATAGTGVEVSKTEDNRLKLEIPSDISFDTGRSDIKSNFRPVLDTFAGTLSKNPNATVTIIGHTDNTGSDAVNNPLSVNRAASARNYLVNKGIVSNRFQIEGRGSREPVASNDNSSGRAQNRRVEIFVAEKETTAQLQ
ncbi:MAG TPA: OmpA family protein [Methylophilaceae bacterium]|nr:OmpA family protein [Methylophilaceae bacterium]